MKMYIAIAWDASRVLIVNRRDCKWGFTPPIDKRLASADLAESNAWALKTYGTDEVAECVCGLHNDPSAEVQV